MSRASSQAAARLARSEKRAPTGTLEQPAPQIPVEEQLDPKSVFEQAYGACTAGKFDEAFKLLFPIWMADECVLFERKSLPALLMLSVEGGNTMLHLAASNGSSGGVTNLLRLGASAAQRNASGQSSADVAQAAGHVEIAELLRSHDAIWSGWGIVELSCLLCLYNGSERFDDSEAYLGRLIERDRAKHGIDGPGSLFREKSLVKSLARHCVAEEKPVGCPELLAPAPLCGETAVGGTRVQDSGTRVQDSGTPVQDSGTRYRTVGPRHIRTVGCCIRPAGSCRGVVGPPSLVAE